MPFITRDGAGKIRALHDVAQHPGHEYLAVAELEPRTAEEIAADRQARFDNEQLVKAVAIWAAQKLGVPLATARNEILAIYRRL